MKVIKTLAVSLVLLLGTFLSLSAQTRQVSGKVLDKQQQPIIGAAVIASGTNGVITGNDGDFAINLPQGDVTVDVNCLGYESQKVKISAAQGTITIVLADDSMLLNETVVVGYGTQKKVNLTGAITTVGSDELKDRPAHSLTNMLQGSVPGLNISTSAGNPGSAGSLNIRGVTSISGVSSSNELVTANAPIVMIDGSIGDLSRVNPNDVESISVIKDASAAAVYGARAAYGVILITTKSGATKDGKATIRYSGRIGWEEGTTNTDYETRGYWSVYTINKFWMQENGGNKYINYTDEDMRQLLARVNDKTENPDRPWVVTDVRNGKNQWVYYGNTDWYHSLFNDRHPVQQHNVSVSGGNKDIKYFLSAGYDEETGIMKQNPDVFRKFNIRSKIDAKLNKYMNLSNNTSFYGSKYSYTGVGNVQNAITYSATHALACFPLFNPDGSGIYQTPYTNYAVANGRQIVWGNDKNVNIDRKNDFTNTTELTVTPFKNFNIKANVTYRTYQNRNTNRQTAIAYRIRPDEPMQYYSTGAGEDRLDESIATYNYISGNVFGTYENTFAQKHHLTAMLGYNIETLNRKTVTAAGLNLQTEDLNDLDLVGPNAAGLVLTEVGGGQTEYALIGFFGRLNYDYKGRYLFETSGRYDGTSRFGAGNRWGIFPSASAGWRVSEEPWFTPLKSAFDNLKVRFSFGTLGNQNVSNYAYLRTISIKDFAGYSFGEGSTMSKYSTLSAPVAGDLTWETTYQYNLGLDAALLDSRLQFTGEAYIRDTKNMLTDGIQLPAVFGADSPKMNAADLRTKGYELSLSWRDQITLFGQPFGYNVKGTLSDYVSHITKYDNNPNKLLNDYYVGQRIGDIWGFVVDGLFETTEEAQRWQNEVVDCTGYITGRMTGGFQAGDLRYLDLDNDGEGVKVNTLGIGKNTADNPGDRKILGNGLPSLQYGVTLGFDYLGFDVSAFFQGTGTHYWYPYGRNYAFWGCYGYTYGTYIPKDFLSNCWSEENPDAYFPKPRAYSSTGGELSFVNSRYIQNVRYLRFKNLTVGYTVPSKLTKKIALEKVRVYFSGENLCYWSPLKKVTDYLDPESAYTRTDAAYNYMAYPWQKTMMFGIDITF